MKHTIRTLYFYFVISLFIINFSLFIDSKRIKTKSKNRTKGFASLAYFHVKKESEYFNKFTDIKKKTSCYRSMNFALNLLVNANLPGKPIKIKKSVTKGLFSCFGCGVDVLENVPFKDIRKELVDELTSPEKKILAFDISPNHHFAVMKFESDNVSIFQAYQGLYSLNDWMNYYKNDEFITYNDFMNHLEILFYSSKATNDEKKDSLRSLFLPKSFKNDEKIVKSFFDDFPELDKLEVKNIVAYSVTDENGLKDEKTISYAKSLLDSN